MTRRPSAEFRAITTLVPRIAAATVLVLLIGTYATNNDVTGTFNKQMYIAIVAIAVLITAAFVRSQVSTKLDVGLALVSSAGLVWGIEAIERPQLLSYWEGFGNRVALGVLILVVLFGTILNPARLSKGVRIVLGLAVVICCLCDVLGAIRTADFFPLVGNNLNQVNDMLAPAAGKVPDASFVPEYTALYGWLLAPVKNLLSPAALVGATAILLTVLSMAAVFLAVWIVRRLLGAWGFLLALALIVPITLVTSRLVGDTSSIASFSQELPIRIFSGLVIAAIGLHDLVLLYRGTVRPWRLLIIGAVCGLLAWNSQDFGVVATGVYGLMIVVGATSSIRIRALGMWLVGLLIGLSSYPLFLLAIGSPLNVSFVGAFVKSAGSLGSAPIQVPGPVLVVIPMIICSTGVGWALMWLRRRHETSADALLDRATVTLTFVGTWASISMVYYINRAYAAGQLQTMLLPCGVCVATVAAIVARTDEFKALWQPTTGSSIWATWSAKAAMLPTAIFICLCFAATLLTTDPVQATRNLVDPPAADGYTTFDLPQVIAAVDAAQRFTADRGGELTYLGESFNYVSLVTHVPSSAVLFGYPFSVISSVAQTQVTQIECGYLREHRSKWLVLSVNGVTGFGDSVCGIYHSVNAPGLAVGQLQELT